jgi:hypothetical protein
LVPDGAAAIDSLSDEPHYRLASVTPDGAVLRLRRNADLTGALGAALAAIATAAKSPVPVHAAAAGVLTPMIELTMVADELAEELATPDRALPGLEEMINYWDRAVSAEPLLLDFEHAKERIAYFRDRVKSLERQL